LRGALELLRENVRCLPQLDEYPDSPLLNRGLADLLAFDLTREKVN